jgi:hypothetical protein
VNDAISWALEQSKYKGAVRTVLMAISRRAHGCRADCSPAEICRFLRMGSSTYRWAVSELQKAGDVEKRVLRVGTKIPVTAYHLQGFCHSAQNIGKSCTLAGSVPVDSGKPPSPLATQRSSSASDPRITPTVENSASGKPSGKLQRSFLFPDILTAEQAKDVCEECRGTGWRTVKYVNSDGDEAEGAVICSHAIVRLAGRWSFKESFTQERFLNEQIAQSIRGMAKPGPHPVKVPTQLRLKLLA